MPETADQVDIRSTGPSLLDEVCISLSRLDPIPDILLGQRYIGARASLVLLVYSDSYINDTHKNIYFKEISQSFRHVVLQGEKKCSQSLYYS